MKKEDFLEILRDYLKKGFSEDEVMDILRDYEEYFVDGIIEGKSEIEIIQSLGSPKEIANELLAESNIKSENKVKGKVENFFIEAKGKFKSGLNKFKVNLNDKEHVKSRKKIEILQVLLTIILLPFAFAIVCSTIGVGIGLIGSLIALVIGTPFAISLTNVMPEVKTLIIFLFIAYIGFEILIWQLFIAVVRLEKKAFKIYITWIKTNQLYIDGSIKKEEIERHDEKRIVTGVGVVLLITGIVGSIWSGIEVMPKLINDAQAMQNNLNQQEVLYKGKIDLAKLNINSKVSNIIIKKYDGKDVIVERSGNKNLSTITTKESGSELTIDEEFNNNNNNLGKSIDDIVRYLVDELYTSHNSDITVYIPENIDINVNTNNGGLYINGVNANNLNFNTQYGNISLSENSNIKTLNIKSNSDISLKVREVYCIDNLSIESNYVNIYEGTFVEDESKIPESIKILAQGGYDNSVNINTNLPIAKNLDITSEENVDLKLPISDYKFNFDIKTSNSISFDENSVSKYLGTSLENYINSNDTEHILNEKSFKGLINEELINNPTEYFVNIRSANVKFN